MDLIKIREKLHQIPELAFQEFKTQNYLQSLLKNYSTIKTHPIAKTGLLVEYSQGKDEYLLFRADMDALPITEQTACSFSSAHQGIMHACGHDIHMTILVGLIDFVVNSSLKKNILFLFQPAEEGKGGAKEVLESSIIQEFSIKHCFALHVSGNYPVGTVAAKSGIFFANTQEIDITIHGKSAHVAFPLEGNDTIEALKLFLHRLDTLLLTFSRNDKPILCYFGKIRSGTVRNAVSDYSKLEGTVRALQKDFFHEFIEELNIMTDNVAHKTSTEIRISLSNFYEAVHNSDVLVHSLKSYCSDLNYRYQISAAEMTGEDFGYFSQKYPSLLFWLGASESDKENLHSPKFLPSEKAIQVGLTLLKQFVLER